MSDETAIPGATAGANATLKGIRKRVVPFEEENPSIEPLFINFAHAGFLGEDFYLDVGVLTLESVDAQLNPDLIGDFAVLSRLAMSKRTMVAVRDQINGILEQQEESKNARTS
jgi:hypothetical protein